MKIIILIGLFTIASGFYNDVDEAIDIDALVQDKVLIKQYIACYLDKGPCTTTMTHYKNHIKELYANGCANCDPKMKHIVEVFFLNCLVNYPEEMVLFRAKYDPDGKQFPKLVAEIAKF